MKISKNVLVDNIKKDILDNSVGAISPQDIRRNLLDFIDSVDQLTEFGELNATNFSTVDLRTTRVGLETLTKKSVRGYSSADNVALGYAALKSQIDGVQNTAIGSFSLTCNMYGKDNVAVGFHSLGSTINGYGNIGIGSYSLNNNKEGSFNIALGHGAGYYVDRNRDYQLLVAAHPVDEDYICTNKDGTGLLPLLVGDMRQSTLRLGVGIRELHDDAALQVAGNIHPSTNSNDDLGSASYRFRNLHLTSFISFPSNNTITYNDTTNGFILSTKLDINGRLLINDNLTVTGDANVNGDLVVDGDIAANSGVYSAGLLIGGSVMPDTGLLYDLGDQRTPYRNIHTYNLYSNGIARFNKFQAVEQSHFRHKTIYLASQFEMDGIDGGGTGDLYEFFDPNQTQVDPNAPVQYLMDEDLEGAGFKIGSSGVDYVRNYDFTFKSRNTTWDSLSIDDDYARSAWYSSISIETEVGRHVKTDRILNSGEIGMFTYDYDLGIYLKDGKAYVGDETTSAVAGLGDVNFIASDSDNEEHVVSIQAPNSGVNTFLTFLDNTSGVQGLRGFKTGYISDSELEEPSYFNEEENQRPNRYIISSYNDTDYAKRCFTLLQDDTEGYVGISNFDYSESMLPDTILNVRSTGNAICRLTAENDSDTQAGIELLGGENCKEYGASMHYIKNSGVLKVNTHNGGQTKEVLTISDEDGTVAILNGKMASNAMLSLGDDDNPNAHISLHHSSGVPIPTDGYGQIFTRTVEGIDLQSTLLSFMDSSGNLFNVDLTSSSEDGTIIDKPLGLDTYGNTFGGVRSPVSRSNITNQTQRNTTIGYEGLSNLTLGQDNTAFGYQAGEATTDGTNNVYVGSKVGGLDGSYNILIGTDLEATNNEGELLIGHGNNPIIEGQITGDNKYIRVASDLDVMSNFTTYGNMAVTANSSLSVIPPLGVGGAAKELMRFQLTSPNPTLDIRGNLNILGGITFGNGSSVPDGSFLDDIADNDNRINQTNSRIDTNETSFNQLKATVDELVVEGVVEQDIQFDQLPTSLSDNPLEFYIRKKVVNGSGQLVNAPSSATDPNLVLIVLRDPYLSVRKGDYIIAMKVNGEYRPITITGSP